MKPNKETNKKSQLKKDQKSNDFLLLQSNK